jgi:hypothetical protein
MVIMNSSGGFFLATLKHPFIACPFHARRDLSTVALRQIVWYSGMALGCSLGHPVPG